MQTSKRKTLTILAMASLATCLGTGALPALAADGKTTQIIIPYAPGGTTDILGRVLAEKLQPALGTVIADNKPGAGTAIGAGMVARSPADGKTLLIATSTTMAVNPFLYKKLTYNPAKDFTPVAEIAEVPLALVVHPSVDAKTVAELIKLVNEKGGMNYASAGNGSPHHLVAEMFKSGANVKINHVPYKGSSPALTDVVAGHVPMMFADLAPALPFIQSNRVRVLAVTSSKRVPTLPNVPTVAESKIEGLKDFEGVAWQGVVAPAGTPQAVVDQLSSEIVKVMQSPDVKNRLEKDGVVVRTRTAAQFADYIAAETPRWERVVKSSGASVD